MNQTLIVVVLVYNISYSKMVDNTTGTRALLNVVLLAVVEIICIYLWLKMNQKLEYLNNRYRSQRNAWETEKQKLNDTIEQLRDQANDSKTERALMEGEINALESEKESCRVRAEGTRWRR